MYLKGRITHTHTERERGQFSIYLFIAHVALVVGHEPDQIREPGPPFVSPMWMVIAPKESRLSSTALPGTSAGSKIRSEASGT